MKKLTIFILTIFTVATLFAAARPSLDGRAVVAESGSMPRGLFARTVGYLPGDSVTVTNPATGSTIDVLVLGAIDPSEGVAILLSPESAEALRIKPESNVQVKLTKRAGSLDENANGSAVLSEGDDEESPAPAEIAANDTANAFEPEESAPVTTKREVHKAVIIPDESDYEEIAAAPEQPARAEVVEEIPVVAEKPAVEETPVVEEVPVVAKNTEPLETLYEEVPPIQTEDEELQKVVLIGATEEKIESPAAEEIVTTDEELVAEEKVTENPSEPLQQVIVVEKEMLVDADGNELQPVIEELPVYVEESRVVAEELPYGIESEPEVEVTYADDMPYSEEEIDAYQPIVLVPTEENPPVAENEPVEVEIPAPTADEIVVNTVSEPEKTESVAIVLVAEEEKPVVTNDWSNYVVPSVKNLRSGSYYVQVASLGSEENIKNFVDTYSDKYPVVLVQNGAKTAYQVMVGPLNIDEYGAVGEKFKDYGFKDSFVRKIR